MPVPAMMGVYPLTLVPMRVFSLLGAEVMTAVENLVTCVVMVGLVTVVCVVVVSVLTVLGGAFVGVNSVP